ncbi:ABC transporter permease subunit [Candidatus Poribacteria bacterium]|nr:ABC transporter permease subunit [Candidatus Poribacteria bacterium]MYH79403.1 ABC transporter permease subunit [Candidatus Poribacteria bacterium]MYK96097.1 ABC transporter permease subunit [Candidatus Poribacteria bacterium]
MLITLIRKEMMHHILSARFIALLLMCVLLIPLNFHINYHRYLQRQVDYQETVKDENNKDPAEQPWLQKQRTDPNLEVSKLILKPTPLSVFGTGLESALPSYLGMTRNGIQRGETALSTAPIAFLFGHLDFVFVVSTVFSLLSLLFTFDAVTGEKEAGTLRITLANALPRDILLWSKLIGGYLVFIVPFLVSFIIGLLVLVLQGFPLSESDIFPRVLCLIGISLLYISVFFAMGAVISIYFDSSKTALIVAFTFWVFAVLILPRVGFLAAQTVAPTSTAESVYREKTARRAELRATLETERSKIMGRMIQESKQGVATTGIFRLDEAFVAKMNEKLRPLEETARLKYRDLATQLDRRYTQERKRQDKIGINFSRITPTSSFIFLATDATQTGQVKRDTYFQTGTRYYEVLDAEMFSKMSDAALIETAEIPSAPVPPPLAELTLEETLQHAALDLLLLCFFTGGFTSVAFLKFFRSDI